MAKRRWQDLSPGQRGAIMIGAAVQFSLTAAALADIRRRPAEQIRGPKLGWTLAAFINFVGPLAYFIAGCRD